MKRKVLAAALCAAVALCSIPVARAADADVTGLVPTIWWDFETQPDAAGLTTANKGSASISFSNKGAAAYAAGVTNGWALSTDGFSPYSATGGNYSTAGNAFTVSAVMTLGTRANGVTLNVRCETAGKDLVIRRGAEAGSLVIGLGPQKAVSTHFLNATIADGDTAFHLVSIAAELSGTSLYVDGNLVTNTTEFSLCSASGCASRMQFGERLSANQSPEVAYGGLIDDLRIHDAALTPAQIQAIGRDVGLLTDPDFIAVFAPGADTVGKDSFSTSWKLDLAEDQSAEAALVHGTDAALSAPVTNIVGSALPSGSYTASLTGLASGTTYWWKIVASNGVNWAETPVASFRTLDVVDARSFTKRIPVTVSGYAGTETLADFPVLVRLAADSPTGFDYADCAADGSDIRFAASDGTMLSHEIESWDTNGTSYVWVKVPVLSGKTTALSLYYGADPNALPAVNPADVWTRYAAVFHGGSTIADSTGKSAAVRANTVTGSASGGKVGGVMSKAQQSVTGVQFSNPVKSGAMSSATKASVSGWYKRSNSGNTVITAANVGAWGGGGFLALVEGGSYFSVAVSSTHQGTGGQGGLVKDVWGHLAFACDGSNVSSYFNGSGIYSGSKGKTMSDPGETYWAIGSYSAAGNDGFIGDMDEVRFFNGVASADWFKAEYDSVADPASFVSLSPAESTDPDLPRFGALSASDANGVATFSVPLTESGYGGEVPTAVSVFYGTDGETWTELSLGSTNETATLTASASGFAVGVRYLWYAVATATSGGTPKTTVSQPQSFVARAFDPTGNFKFFTATVVWDGAPAENLPFLLRISEGGVNGFDYDDVTASGLEILDASGQLLPFEIDTWNTDGESLVWVLLPVYEDGATITVRYGAQFANAPLPATDVWTGYAGVWHMNETYDATTAATGLSHDSTGNGLDATPSKGSSGNLAQMVSAPGVVGNARVNATSDTSSGNYLSVPNYDSLALGDTFAVSGWFKATIINGYPRLLSRKTAYNTDNGWELENGNGNAKAFSARGASGDAISLNTPSYDNAWVHIALVYNGTTLSAYANGAPCGSGTIAAATDNGKPLSFGNNSNGSERSLAGLYDEIRLLDATPSAARIAAEYHAMADVGAISLSSVSSSDISAPVLGIPSVASNPDGSFTVSVEVSENTPASIVCMVGGTELAMTTSGASLPVTYTATFSQLQLAAGTHVATVRATATSGTVVSSTCPTAFHVGSLTIVKQSDADEGTLTPGVFRVSRLDADSTGMPAVTFNVAFSGSGLAAIAAPGISTATIPAGAAYVDIAVTPVPTDEVDEDSELVLTVSGAHVGQQSTATLTVVDAGFDLAVRYVSTDGNDANSGGTPEAAKKTIAAAVAAVNPVAPLRPCTVHVASGLYPISTPLVVTNAISVIGDDPDPSRTVVSNADRHGDWGVTRRVFTINHADAFVANLTMQSGYMLGSDSGGNFSVGSAGGTVSNCVIEAGDTRGNNYAAGGRLSGGLVTHTIFRKNICGSGMGNWQGQHGGVLELYGSSRAENCLLVDNPPSGTVYLSLIGDSAVMRNCTIADTGLKSTNEYCKVFTAIRINSANATVLNTVIAGVTNTIDGAACPPTGSGVANFLNGAFDGDATGLPEGTVVGTASSFFKDYANGDYTPKAKGPLVNKGENYEGMAAKDLAGNKRQVGSKIDIGCYEAVSTPLLIIVR